MKHTYLDYAASTPVRSRVLKAMKPYWERQFGNPSSVHRHGQEARHALEQARASIAQDLGCLPAEVIFLGCGSESDNLAIRGTMWSARNAGRGNHFITCSIEHKAVLDTAKQLRDVHGFDLTIQPVDQHGQIDVELLESAIRPDTALISIMVANNEIGTVNPFREIGALARRHGVLFHTDAIQTATTFAWNLSDLPIDLFTLSAHKFYGPKGFGILVARSGVELLPVLTGGGQEEGLRAGTSNVPLAVGTALALRLAREEMALVAPRLADLRDRLIDGILTRFGEECVLTGHPTSRLPHIASFAFRNLDGNDLLLHLDQAGFSASSGSACLTGAPEPSPVLEAIGLDTQWTSGGLRLSLGRNTNEDEIERFLNAFPAVVGRMRKFHHTLAGRATAGRSRETG